MRTVPTFIGLLLLTLLISLWSKPAACSAQKTDSRIIRGGYILARGNTIISQYRAGERFKSASTIKLLTALVVLDTLGPDFRFTTNFYLDSQGILHVKGGGDPFLTSENLADISQALKSNGVEKINGYSLDTSVFRLEQPLPDGSENSANPYDVANGALAINFNTMAISRQPGKEAESGEEQTPTVPLTRELGNSLKPGSHRINIGYRQLDNTPYPHRRYVGELLHALNSQAGIESTPGIKNGTIPPDAKPVHTHLSPQNVREMLRACLLYSNNFVANQLLLTAAAHQYGSPATWQKARKLLHHYATVTLDIPEDAIVVMEGSGISRKNEITPTAMLTVLNAFSPHRDLLPEKFGVQVKSGTMKAVYCYAGYLDYESGLQMFAILLNQKVNTRDEILLELKKDPGH